MPRPNGWSTILRLAVATSDVPTGTTGGIRRADDKSAATAGAASTAQDRAWLPAAGPGELHAEHTQPLQLRLLLCEVRRGLQQRDAVHGLRLGGGVDIRWLLPRAVPGCSEKSASWIPAGRGQHWLQQHYEDEQSH